MKRIKVINRNGEQGITLIALVVTIVVLLILAGITITFVLSDGGILQKAREAANKTNNAIANEQGDMDKLPGDIENLVNKGEKLPVAKNAIAEQYGIKQTEGNKELSDGAGGKIVVPKDYTIVNPDTDETIEYKDKNNPTVKEGIVITDEDENEFVWVPVTNPSTMYGEDSNGNYIGKLYDFDSSESTAKNWKVDEAEESKIKWSDMTGSREPDVLKDTSCDANQTYLNQVVEDMYKTGETKTKENFKKQLQDEFKDMCESVAKYKGFYIGRYETSLSEEGKAQSKKGETSLYNNTEANNWYGQYNYNKVYAKKEESKSVVSSTIWGSQYDAMMKWMQSNKINVTSVTPTDVTEKATSKNTTRITGPQSGSNDKLCNIYDLLGNSYEWTMEAYNTLSRLGRGGDYNLISDSLSERTRRHTDRTKWLPFCPSFTLCKVMLDII